MSETKKQNFLKGAAILAVTGITTKIITAIFKIPLFNLLGDEGAAHFQLTFYIYALILTISTAGLPVALSRLISPAVSTGRTKMVRRYFAAALPLFTVLGLVLMALMFACADDLAFLLKDPKIASGIRVPGARRLLQLFHFGLPRGTSRVTTKWFRPPYPSSRRACQSSFSGSFSPGFCCRRAFDTASASAGSNLGSTIGLGLAVPVLIIWKIRFDRRGRASATPERGQDGGGRLSAMAELFKVSIPITLGASILNILTFVDAKVVLTQLESYLPVSEATTLYGVYSKGLSIFNLPSSLAQPIAVTIVPVIAAALATNRRRHAKEIMESSLKLTNIIGMPAGVGMFVLAAPIFRVLYWNSNPIGPELLSTFGIASYFMCTQLVTIGILQANGHEKIPLITCTVGGIAQIALDWYLTGIPSINITGSPFGTLICYAVITLSNLVFIGLKVREKPDLAKAFLKPALCAAVLGVCAWAVYELFYMVGSRTLGTGHLAMTVYLLAAIAVSVAVYAVLVLATKTVTRDDMRLLPRGERLANFLKIK